MPEKKRPTVPAPPATSDTTPPVPPTRKSAPRKPRTPQPAAIPAPVAPASAPAGPVDAPDPSAAVTPEASVSGKTRAASTERVKTPVARPKRSPTTPKGTLSVPRDVRQSPRAKASTAVATPAVPAAAPSLAADGTERLSILMVTPEAHPFAKTGGLAEVAAALPQALGGLGHDVTIVLPRYRGIDTTGTVSLPLAFSLAGHDLDIDVREKTLSNGVRLALIDAPALFDREGLYGDASGDYRDNAWRFAVFGR